MMIDEHLHFTKEIPPENSPHPVGCTRRDMSPSWTDSQASRWKTVENRGVSVSKWGRSFQKMKDERNSQLGIKSEKEMHTPWSVQPCTTLVERNWNIDRLCWIDLCQQCMRKHIYMTCMIYGYIVLAIFFAHLRGHPCSIDLGHPVGWEVQILRDVTMFRSLVGGFSPTPLKNHGQTVSWDDDMTPIYGKRKTCSKPPTSSRIHIISHPGVWRCLE